MYRVVVPARRKATVTVRGTDLALGLWGPLARTVWTGSSGRLGASDRTTTTETLALINRSKRAVVFYAHVQLSRKAQFGNANYTLGGSHHEVGSGCAGSVPRACPHALTASEGVGCRCAASGFR